MSQVDIILKEIFGNDEDSTEEGHDADVPRPTLGREGHITKRRKTDVCCSKVEGGMEGGPAASSSALVRDLKSSHTQLLGADGGVIRPLPGLVVVRGGLNAQQQLSLAGAILDSGCLVGETSAPQPPTQPQHQGGAVLGAGAEAWVAGGEGGRCTGCGAGRSGQVNSQPAQTGSFAAGAGGSSDSGTSGGRGVGGGGAGGGGIRRGAPNQAMFFGPLPQWGQHLQQLLPLEQLLPPHLAARAPSFDQAIVNLYRPGEGITDHVDLARFQDGVVGVSVGGPIVMDFRRLPGRREGAAGGQAGGEVADAEVGYNREAVGRLLQGEGDGEGEGGGACPDGEGEMPGVLPESCPGDGVWWLEDEEATVAAAAEAAARAGVVGPAAGGPYSSGPASGVRKRRRRHHLRVLLQGGDLIGMSGAARYGWTHGIAQGVARERVLLPRGTQAAAVAEEEFVESASLGEEEELGQGQAPVGVLQCVPRGVRLSVTLRRLVPHIVLCEEAGEEGPAGEQVV